MKKIKYILFAVLSVIFISSCVKENRINCPCYLLFAHDGFDNNEYFGDINLFIYEDGHKLDDSVYDIVEMIEDKCDIPVKRGYHDVCGVGGIKYMDIDRTYSLRIPYGYQCDPIYAFHDDVTAQGERALVFGTIHKQYATVYLNVNITADNEAAVKVIGNTSGLDIRTMEPLDGEFCCLVKKDLDGYFSFRVPRQRNSSLDIEVWDTPVGSNPSISTMIGCSKLTSLNIGSIISDRLQYDWNASSLPDIYIDVDFVRSMMTITIKEWGIDEVLTLDV